MKTSEILNDSKELAEHKEEKKYGDKRTCKAEAHPNCEIDDNPYIPVDHDMIMTILISDKLNAFPTSRLPSFPISKSQNLTADYVKEIMDSVKLEGTLEEG